MRQPLTEEPVDEQINEPSGDVQVEEDIGQVAIEVVVEVDVEVVEAVVGTVVEVDVVVDGWHIHLRVPQSYPAGSPQSPEEQPPVLEHDGAARGKQLPE